MAKRSWTATLAIALLVGSGAAFAADEKQATQGGEKTAAATDGSSPKDVCKNLAEATRKDDFASAKQWIRGMDHPGKGHKAEKGFHRMHKDHMAKLKDLSCGSEHIAGNRAFVETESQGERRLIPFVQEGGKWLFDARTYMSFYGEGKGMRHGHKHGRGDS